MNQAERRQYLIRTLLAEQPQYGEIEIPEDPQGQKDLLRALMNVRQPAPVSDEYREVERAYLLEAAAKKGIVSLSDLSPVREHRYLWQGDITTLKVDAIVNAANAGLLGCMVPNHLCIDNAIHTFSGVELRLACHEIIQKQGHAEPTGTAKITPGFHLPATYVLHTVGPIVSGPLTKRHEELLASCYKSCLDLARQNGLLSVAFCCISTGVFCFPNRRAAEIAIETVDAFAGDLDVVFNVWKEKDHAIYRALL